MSAIGRLLLLRASLSALVPILVQELLLLLVLMVMVLVLEPLQPLLVLLLLPLALVSVDKS